MKKNTNNKFEYGLSSVHMFVVVRFVSYMHVPFFIVPSVYPSCLMAPSLDLIVIGLIAFSIDHILH